MSFPKSSILLHSQIVKKEKFISYRQIMVLNPTRYPNSLLLMSQYIAEEQNLLANFQQDNKFEKLLSSYSQVTIRFKPNFLKNIFQLTFF